MEVEEEGVERSALVDRELSAPEVPRRILPLAARRFAGAAALILVALVVSPWAIAFEHGSLRFVQGVAPTAWQALRAELTASEALPTVGLAHISSEAGKVLCVIDVTQATGWIMTFGSFVKFSTVACDYDRIRRVNKREVRNDERERCTTGIFGIMLSLELGMGVTASSVSTCSGALNVPSNCVANIGAFTGGISTLMLCTLSTDLICAKGAKQAKNTPEEKKNAIVANKEAKITKAKDQAARSVNNWLIKAGFDVDKLPAPPALSADTVYGAINRCVAQVAFGATFVMRMAIILADSTIHCAPDVVSEGQQGRICAIDITGILATLSLAIRFFSLVSSSCINIVGRTDNDANCVASIAGISGATMAATASGMNLEAACKTAFGDWNPDNWPNARHRVSATGQSDKHLGEDLSVPAADGNVLLPEV